MVELGVPTANFGRPPDPEHPQPHFPGVSSTRFNPIGALLVYRQVMKKEKDIRADHQEVWKLRPGQPEIHGPVLVGDMLPNLKSLNAAYDHLGWSTHPTTRRRLPPDPGELQPLPGPAWRALPPSRSLGRSNSSPPGEAAGCRDTLGSAVGPTRSSRPADQRHMRPCSGPTTPAAAASSPESLIGRGGCVGWKPGIPTEKEMSFIMRQCGTRKTFAFC